MSDAIVLDVADATPVRLDVGDSDPIARQEIAELAGRVTTVEGDVTALDSRMDTAEGDISTLGTTVDGIDARVEAIEADGSVTTAKLADGAVTPRKLADTPFPSLLAGAARSLTGDEPTEATFLDRACPGTTGQATVQSVRGNTLRWNQLVQLTSRTATSKGITYTAQGGKVTFSAPNGAEGVESFYTVLGYNYTPIAGHKYIAYGTSADRTVIFSHVSIGTLPPNVVFTTEATQSGQFAFRVDGSFTGTYECYPQLFDLTAMFGAGNEPATVAEFEALFPEPYYPYDAGSLLPVRMEGVETTGDGWSSRRAIPAIAENFPDGMRGVGDSRDELTNHEAIHRIGGVTLNGSETWSKSSSYSGGYYITDWVVNNSIAYATNHVQDRFATASSISEYKEWTCYFENALNLRVPETVAPTVNDFVAWLAEHPVTVHYPLATPTTAPIDPPLNLTYRAENGGTERITHTEQSAPPVLSIAYGHTADGIVAQATSAIAAQDGPTATTNHAVGSYLTMGGTLYRVTTAIATGEAIVPGTNVTATTVMAEVMSLIQ